MISRQVGTRRQEFLETTLTVPVETRLSLSNLVFFSYEQLILLLLHSPDEKSAECYDSRTFLVTAGSKIMFPEVPGIILQLSETGNDYRERLLTS